MVNQGDIILVSFDPSLGHEQKGFRPAVVVSSNIYHEKTSGLAILVPITSTKRIEFPLHIDLDNRTTTQGQLLCEQLKTIDTVARKVRVIEKLPNDLLDKTLKLVKLLF